MVSREPVPAAEFFLQNILDHFLGDGGSPGCNRPVKACPFPPIRLSSRQMEGNFGRTIEGLANPVTGREWSFLTDRIEAVEFSLLWVGTIREPGAALELWSDIASMCNDHSC
jgi:hypothetical protein